MFFQPLQTSSSGLSQHVWTSVLNCCSPCFRLRGVLGRICSAFRRVFLCLNFPKPLRNNAYSSSLNTEEKLSKFNLVRDWCEWFAGQYTHALAVEWTGKQIQRVLYEDFRVHSTASKSGSVAGLLLNVGLLISYFINQGSFNWSIFCESTVLLLPLVDGTAMMFQHCCCSLRVCRSQ